MDTSTSSSGELETSIESFSSGVEDQREVTYPLRPSPFTLRSQCASGRCPQGTGILFRWRISPSPSKTRLRSRRRRRSDQSRHNRSDSSSFLEISHENGRLQEHEHLHHHHHHHDHYPHDGIHNIDHHHVHVQDQQLLHTPPRIPTPKQIDLHVHEPLQKLTEIRFQDIQRENYQTQQRSQEHTITRADILFDELRQEEKELAALKEMAKKRTVKTSESTTTTVRRSLIDPSSNGGPQVGIHGGVTGIAESVKNTVMGFLTPSKEKTLPAIVESSESGFEDGNMIGDKRGTSTPNELFVPAREFFAEADTRERLSDDYYSRSDTPSRLRESTRRLSLRKPYNQYIAYSSDEEYDDWKQQPKSDYTYSASLTYRERVTPDRKIGSPNMSRRTLKGGSISYVQTSDFSGTELASDASDSLNLRSRRIILKPMDALSDTSDAEEVAENYQTRSRRSTRSRSNDMPRTNGSLTRTINTVSTAFTTTTTLHRGLDTESDGEDGPGHQSAIPLRPTPLSRKSGTPLGRAMTPLSKFNSVSRRSSTLDAGKGYKLGEGTIAEDLEEEDERLGSTVMVWSRKTWQQITRITTIITASITMMAASALTPTSKEDTDIDEKKSSSHSFTSTVRETRTRIVTTVSEKYNAACERLRKNPILIWIPLLILLLLAFLAYWWLLQSRGKTAGATDPTENDGPSFFFIFFKLVSDLVSWVYSGISSTLAAAWVTTAGTCTWLATACKGVLVFAWLSIVNMFTWLGSLAVSFAASLLQLLYLSLEYLQYCALGVTSFFTSSASFLYGLLPFATSNDTVIHDSSNAANLQDSSWSFTAWVSNVSPKERLSEMYVGVSERVQSLGTKLWDIWLWQVLCIGEMLSAIATYAMWLLSSICSAFVYLLTGLWTLLTSFILAVISAPTVITSSAIVSGIKSNVMNIFKSSGELVNKPSVISTPSAKIETIENIVQQSINIKEGSVEEIVRQVLDSEELKRLIAAAVAENSKGQLTVDAVSGIAKSVVEREFGVLKEETSALKTEIQTNAAANAEHQNKILQLQEEKAHLINELAKLGQRLYNVEGKIDIADQKSIDDRQENEEQIEQLIQQINKLEVDHTNLAADVKSCCDDKKVPAILGEIFGLTANGTTDEETAEGQASLSAGDIGVWLRSYFVAKTELESRLNSLMATMQVKTDVDEGERNSATIALTQAAVDQTTQIVMDAVLEKLRGEMNKQHHQLSEETQQQVKAAAGILGQQVLEQVQLQVQNQKQQLSETLKVNVDSAVQDAVSSALPGAVDSAVETAVEKAVSSSVDVAVMNAVNTAVPTAVNEAVPQAVEKAVPEAVAELLPNAVSEQVATAVPEVVASVLPAAVSTAVNETVTSVVSEAMVHVSLNKAGDQTIEINQKVVKNEIVGVVGSTSAAGNHSHEASDGGIFVPGMHMAVGLNESAVIQIVQDALKKYDADKTGMVDHALESAGGNIISTRCTESYQVHQAEVRVLGFPVYRYSTNNPRTVIQPDTMPGQCWAFKGSQGYIVIQLAGPVQPTGFTLEHISKSLSPNGAIDSAPREFEVWGLSTESDEGVFLGIYEYREDGDPLQYFPVREENTAHFPLIELKINSNHGNLQYTCLYRFRVHGFRLL